MNYIKKHALKLEAAGVERGSARLFSNPAGDYGSLVNERVGNGDWEDEEELGATWQSRNAFSFGRGGEKGVSRQAVLEELLATTDRVVQEIDSVEYGLTDIQVGAEKGCAVGLCVGLRIYMCGGMYVVHMD